MVSATELPAGDRECPATCGRHAHRSSDPLLPMAAGAISELDSTTSGDDFLGFHPKGRHSQHNSQQAQSLESEF